MNYAWIGVALALVGMGVAIVLSFNSTLWDTDDLHDIEVAMVRLAQLTRNSADARAILESYSTERARSLWQTIWDVEMSSRTNKLLADEAQAELDAVAKMRS